MANEAYRAVFLRVHPTGKMVLSLTTDSDGKESQYAQLVADELGVPALDVKVVPADTDRFGVGHGFNTRPSDGAPAAIAKATAKIRDKGQLLAGMALDAAPETLTWSNGAWVGGDGSDPNQVKTVEDIALYAHGTGALPPGVEGGLDAQSVYSDYDADSGRGGQGGVDRDLDLIDDLQRAPQRAVGLHPPVALLDDGDGADRAGVVDGCSERERGGLPISVRSPCTLKPLSSASSSTPVDSNVMVVRLRISSWIVSSMPALSSSPRACMPPTPSLTTSEAPSTVSVRLEPAPSAAISSCASHFVMWMHEVVPRLGRRSGALRPHQERAVGRPEPVAARLNCHGRIVEFRSLRAIHRPPDGGRRTWQ